MLFRSAYAPHEKDRAQAVINFAVFAVMAITSFASGALVTTSGWFWLNALSLLPLALTAWMLWSLHRRGTGAPPAVPAAV